MPRQLPPLNALVAVEATLRHGSVQKAAVELRVTASAVSQHLRHVEELYDVELFVRHARGISTTDAGKRLLPALSRAFDELDEAALPLVRGKKTERLRISLLPALAGGWLLPLLPDFRRHFPEIDLTLHTSPRFVDFDAEDVDFAVRYAVSPPPELGSLRLFGELVFPVVSPALVPHGPLDAAALGALPLLHDVDAEPAQPVLGWNAWFASEGLKPPEGPGLRFSDSSVLLEAAARGLGVALGRGPLVEPHLRRGQLVRASTRAVPSDRSYWLVGPKRNFRKASFQPILAWFRTFAGGSDGVGSPRATADGRSRG